MSATSDTAASHEAIPSASKTLRRLFLTLFLRGRSARHLQKDQAPKSIGRKLAFGLLFYVLFGSMAFFFARQTPFMLSAYLHAMTLMFLGMFVASSAGEILFNREEADILMHRPIEPRSLLWAKVRVLTEVSLWLAGAFNLAGLFVGATQPGGGGWRYPLAHILSTILLALFCTGFVVTVYQLCLRWFGRERLEGLMTTAQVFVSIAAVMSGQLIPQILEFVKERERALSGMWYLMALPPAWFAGLDDALAGSGAAQSWVLAAVGVAATVLVLWAAFSKLAQDYAAGLQVLNEHRARPGRKFGRGWLHRLVELPPLGWWLRDPRQRAAFLLSAAYLARDRDVKLRVYPAIAPFLIFPLIILIREFAPGDGSSGPGFGFAFGSAYLGVVPLVALDLMKYSQHYQAADVFRAAPLAGPAPLCHGTRKAVMLLLTLPLVAALAVAAWFFKSDPAQLELMVPGLLVVPIVALIPNLGGRGVPLSQPVDQAKSASRGLTMLAAIIGTMALAGAAMGLQQVGLLPWLILGEAVVVAILYILLRRSIDRAPWPEQD